MLVLKFLAAFLIISHACLCSCKPQLSLLLRSGFIWNHLSPSLFVLAMQSVKGIMTQTAKSIGRECLVQFWWSVFMTPCLNYNAVAVLAIEGLQFGGVLLVYWVYWYSYNTFLLSLALREICTASHIHPLTHSHTEFIYAKHSVGRNWETKLHCEQLGSTQRYFERKSQGSNHQSRRRRI